MSIFAVLWLAAAIFSAISDLLEWAELYVLIGAAFGYSAYAAWKKVQNGRRGS